MWINVYGAVLTREYSFSPANQSNRIVSDLKEICTILFSPPEGSLLQTSQMLGSKPWERLRRIQSLSGLLGLAGEYKMAQPFGTGSWPNNLWPAIILLYCCVLDCWFSSTKDLKGPLTPIVVWYQIIWGSSGRDCWGLTLLSNVSPRSRLESFMINIWSRRISDSFDSILIVIRCPDRKVLLCDIIYYTQLCHKYSPDSILDILMLWLCPMLFDPPLIPGCPFNILYYKHYHYCSILGLV